MAKVSKISLNGEELEVGGGGEVCVYQAEIEGDFYINNSTYFRNYVEIEVPESYGTPIAVTNVYPDRLGSEEYMPSIVYYVEGIEGSKIQANVCFLGPVEDDVDGTLLVDILCVK